MGQRGEVSMKLTTIGGALLLLSLALNVYALLQLRDARDTANAALVQSDLALRSAAAICEQVPDLCKRDPL